MIHGAKSRMRSGTIHYDTLETKVSEKQRLGLDKRVFLNKDSPDYKPSFGTEWTERQLKILNEDIPLSDVRTTELTVIIHKAEDLCDEEKADMARYLHSIKTKKCGYQFKVKVEDAKDVLQSLTPWEIKWDD